MWFDKITDAVSIILKIHCRPCEKLWFTFRPYLSKMIKIHSSLPSPYRVKYKSIFIISLRAESTSEPKVFHKKNECIFEIVGSVFAISSIFTIYCKNNYIVRFNMTIKVGVSVPTWLMKVGVFLMVKTMFIKIWINWLNPIKQVLNTYKIISTSTSNKHNGNKII